jgi:hypothetical protein
VEPGPRPIELRIKEIGQLFQSLDPLPFRERDLAVAVEEYVVDWAREMPANRPLEILIHLPKAEAQREEARQIGEAINKYFAYRAEGMSKEIRELFRVGRSTFAIGLAVLASCIVAGSLLEPTSGGRYIKQFIRESLVIMGWVANWRPIEIFLYDWGPLARRRRLFCRLARASVRLVADTSD